MADEQIGEPRLRQARESGERIAVDGGVGERDTTSGRHASTTTEGGGGLSAVARDGRLVYPVSSYKDTECAVGVDDALGNQGEEDSGSARGGGPLPLGRVEPWSDALAADAVFQKMCWTNTYNVFLHAEDLAQLIDEDPREIRRILRVGHRRSNGFELFLRQHGMIPRIFNQGTAWCLLGIGNIMSTFSSPEHRSHLLGAEPNGSFFRGLLELGGPAEKDPPTNLSEFLENYEEFCLDVHHGTKCRRCESNVTMFTWSFVRLESIVSSLLRPDQVAEVGIRFECECGAIHLGVPLPQKSRGNGSWSLEDRVVEVQARKCPVRERAPKTQTRESRRSGGDRGARVWSSLVPRTSKRRNTGPSDQGGGEESDPANGTATGASVV